MGSTRLWCSQLGQFNERYDLPGDAHVMVPRFPPVIGPDRNGAGASIGQIGVGQRVSLPFSVWGKDAP